MKLYTINATPIRKFKQLSDSEKKYIRKGEDTLNAINARALEIYPGAVALTLAKHGIDGFTIYSVQGYWKGEAEASFKIEIATDDSSTVDYIARELRDMYNQDSVMVTLPDNTVEFI